MDGTAGGVGPATATVRVNGIELSFVDQGEGPLVLLLHGFPELAYSWRHQIGPLVTAGYRVVAPDLRGYGATSAPGSAESYTYFDIIGDLVGLMNALGHEKAVVVGHDMGAFVAWYLALVLPQRVRAVAGLSVALRRRPPELPSRFLEQAYGPDFYQLRFQEPRRTDDELAHRVEEFLPGVFVGLSATAPEPIESLVIPSGQGFADLFPPPEMLPDWLSADEMAVYIEAFARTGFTGGLNWYRNIDRNWHLLAPWDGMAVGVPAIYLAGEDDITYRIARETGGLADMAETVADLRETIVLPDCGHWVNQERPEAVNEALLRFLDEVGHAS